MGRQESKPTDRLSGTERRLENIMGVAQEARYKKLVIEQGNKANDRMIQAEAANMVRAPRPSVQPQKSTTATRRQVRAWMRSNAEDYDNATNLAEAANIDLDLPHGAMDDPDHWIWDEAVDAIGMEP